MLRRLRHRAALAAAAFLGGADLIVDDRGDARALAVVLTVLSIAVLCVLIIWYAFYFFAYVPRS